MAGTGIEFIEAAKSYENKEALLPLSLRIEPGEFVSIIGGSGGGKTTMLKMVNGLCIPDSGKVLVNGEDVATADLVCLRRNIGYVIQGTGLFPHMNVWKNIAYVPTLINRHDRARTRKAVENLMQLMDLDADMALRYPAELSGGQQQRVGIARALASSPDIVLMDEPFGAVDGIARRSLQTEIVQLHQKLKMTILFVTHDIREALRLGTRVLVINQGRLVQDATPEQITASPADEFVEDLVRT